MACDNTDKDELPQDNNALEAQISSPNEWPSTFQESCITVILVTQISTPTKLKFHIQIK
jgi:hypothetical protein